jgi:site-specific recombinase XerC
MLMLFLDTGLRLNELITLKQSRIDFVMGELTFLGKGNKERKAISVGRANDVGKSFTSDKWPCSPIMEKFKV